jgi:nitroreductase
MTSSALAPGRKAEHPIDLQFVERWSPRAFTGEAIPDAVLLGALEAARWAPSANNLQPWRFVYSKRGSASWEAFLGALRPGNQRWASNASALVLVASKRSQIKDGQAIPNHSHAFDTGAAWASLALQALSQGWHTHGIGGFDPDAVRKALKVPNDFDLQAVVAIGKRGDKASLPEDLQAREAPNTRRPLAELAFEGAFPD